MDVPDGRLVRTRMAARPSSVRARPALLRRRIARAHRECHTRTMTGFWVAVIAVTWVMILLVLAWALRRGRISARSAAMVLVGSSPVAVLRFAVAAGADVLVAAVGTAVTAIPAAVLYRPMVQDMEDARHMP